MTLVLHESKNGHLSYQKCFHRFTDLRPFPLLTSPSSQVTVHGNATYARSITVNLRKGESEPAEKYECRIESEALCGGNRRIQRVLKTQASEIFEVRIRCLQKLRSA